VFYVAALIAQLQVGPPRQPRRRLARWCRSADTPRTPRIDAMA